MSTGCRVCTYVHRLVIVCNANADANANLMLGIYIYSTLLYSSCSFDAF